MSTSSRYAGRGVSSSKEDVHAAIKNIDKGLYPKAFCKIIPDRLAGDPEACLIMHADGAPGPLLRRQLLYPAELRAHSGSCPVHGARCV